MLNPNLNLDDQKEQHKCPKCDYTTPWKSSIATHMKLKHSSKFYLMTHARGHM